MDGSHLKLVYGSRQLHSLLSPVDQEDKSNKVKPTKKWKVYLSYFLIYKVILFTLENRIKKVKI